MIYAIGWLATSVLAFEWLRRLALRDFGYVTIAGAIFILLVSLAGPVGLVADFFIWIMGRDYSSGFMSKTLWTRRP